KIVAMMADGVLDIVIPALNAAAHLPATLASLEPARRNGMIRSVILVDGGSRDGTRALAAACGLCLVTSAPGRGRQLRAGAAHSAARSRAPSLFFPHADTRLSSGWESDADGFIGADPGNTAAVFTLRMDDHAPAARRLERLVSWRTRRLGLPYGDQGL